MIVELVRVSLADKVSLREWRNDPSVSQWMYTNHEIGEEEHNAWFDAMLADESKVYWKIVADGVAVGSVFLTGISSQGKSVQLDSGVYVTQTIGQHSIASYSMDNLAVQQGYQQSFWNSLINSNEEFNVDITFYPNPTIDDVNVHISGMDKKVMISVFSEKGDLVHRKEQQIQDLSRLTEIDLSLQSTGTYILQTSGEQVNQCLFAAEFSVVVLRLQ